MDFRDWKKTKEDKTSCTLVHPKGHTMTIAIRALPRIHQEQIKRLAFANGGEVPVGMPDPQKAKDAWDGAQNGQMNRLKYLVGMGDKKPEQKQVPQRQGYAGGTPDHPVTADEYIGDEEQAPADKPGNHTPITINVGAPPAQQAPPPPIQPPAGQAQPMKAPVSTAFRQVDQPPAYKVNQPEAAPELLSPDQTPSVPAIVKNQQEVVQQNAEIEKAQSRAAAQSAANNLKNQQTLADQDAQIINEMVQHTNAFSDYTAKNPINPRAFQQNQTSGQKTATAIGLVLGGLSQGFQPGSNNPAMDFLNKQIDRDIDAQKARSDQQKTVYGYYHNLYGDEVIANGLAKVSMNNMTAKELELQAARSGDPAAMARAKAAMNEFMLKNNDIFTKISGRIGALRVGGGTGPQGQPQNGAKKSGQTNGNPVYRILTPDAEQKAMGLQYGPNAAKEEKIQTQYQQAIQAEKLLNGPNNDGVGGISDLLKRMHASAKKSGVYGHLHRTAGEALEQIPLIGPAAGALSGAIPATGSENAYNNAQVQIETDMATALKDIMTPTEIHKLVQKISPTPADSDSDVNDKEKTLANSVMKAVRGGLLGQAQMLRKEK